MRVLIWHGWLLEGTGSNVYTAKTAEVLRKAGHQVLLLCQQRHPERFGFVDAFGTVGSEVSSLTETGAPPAAGRLTLLRPEIGALLPVFVYDEYEGFDVKRFVDLSDRELQDYLDRNVTALRAAGRWFRPDAAIAGHVVPGGAVAARALGPGGYVVKVHGSDIEYAIKLQPRYEELAREGLAGARMVTGATTDVLERAVAFEPEAAGRVRVVPPGVEVDLFRPRPREEALGEAAALLKVDPATAGGRPAALDVQVRAALRRRDGRALDDIAGRYDQGAPDRDAWGRLQSIGRHGRGPMVGYLGKLIPEKGVDVLLCALALVDVPALIVGFGRFREWLTALTAALSDGDLEAVSWLRMASPMTIELSEDGIRGARAAPGRLSLGSRVAFTGRLDHRYAPFVLAAMDVLVVPSILDEAFGMVAAEGAAAGALPLVARHSGLAEVAEALEAAVGRPGLFSYQPGPDAHRRIAEGIERLLGLPDPDRAALRAEVSEFARSQWTWDRTAEGLLDAARS
jgi:glycosyltransferase involved in cell wall biosynthesis